MKNGKEKFILTDKSMYYGIFLDNNFNGLGEFKWPDGRKYEG